VQEDQHSEAEHSGGQRASLVHMPWVVHSISRMRGIAPHWQRPWDGMYSVPAQRSLCDPALFGADLVTSIAQLLWAGWTWSAIRAQLRARRWQRIGRAIIKHNGAPTRAELARAALITVSARVRLTSFTALEHGGLTGWERNEVHVLVPRGARVCRPVEIPLRVHYTDRWEELTGGARNGIDALPHSALLAASSFKQVRPACGVLAAAVQQRLVRPDQLIEALTPDRRLRHHRQLLAAAHDIQQGAEALSEIDFARLCRRHGMSEPVRQAVRREPGGRRRYLDATWVTASGRRLVVEVDGALHLVATRWWADQLRQNELVLTGDSVLRFPSVLVRSGDPLVLDHLRRGLLL
jgi:hypothetical protein